LETKWVIAFEIELAAEVGIELAPKLANSANPKAGNGWPTVEVRAVYLSSSFPRKRESSDAKATTLGPRFRGDDGLLLRVLTGKYAASEIAVDLLNA